MELDVLKLKRLCEGKTRSRVVQRTTKRLTTDEKGRQIYVDQPGAAGERKAAESVDDDDAPGLDEGKKHKTPEFVRHCVAAITEKPEDLKRVQQDAPGPEEGSPFAICYAKYKGNKRSLAAKHAKGEHHTVKQYEKALATLREDLARVRQQNVDRSQVIHSDVQVEVTPASRHCIRYIPE